MSPDPNLVPGVTQPFATFRTYKSMYPVCPSGFSSYRGYGKLLEERSHMRILGHAGRILRSYLHDLCDHNIQACYRSGRILRIQFLLGALFGYFGARNHRVAFSTSRESLPMGVKC
jgi:hypothetical protein